MKTRRTKVARRTVIMAVVMVLMVLALASAASARSVGRWVAGDIHTHTWLTDGKNTQGEVLRNAFENYGLDYVANSEHGGQSANDPAGIPFVTPVWRWITLSNYSYPIIQDARALYPEKRVIQGVEWNAPTHEHVSVGIVGPGNEPGGIGAFEYRFDAKDTDASRAGESTKAVTHSETFVATIAPAPTGATEAGNVVTLTTLTPHHIPAGASVTVAGVGFGGYNGTFTVASVTDMTLTYTNSATGLAPAGDGTVSQKVTVTDVPAIPFDKVNKTAADTVTAVKWLNDTFSTEAYAIVNHPSRAQLWHVGDFRAMNDAAPAVAFGMEGLPGHQPDLIGRGGYDYTFADPAVQARARAYGGADWMVSQVGGLWDSLLGEGRHWWIFDNSDYHTLQTQFKDAAGNYYATQYFDFWPGQYAKTWTYVKDSGYEGLVQGMRSGRVFVANGDLIDGLDFTATVGKRSATMGQTLKTKAGAIVTVRIAMRSPKMNANGDSVNVDHVDVVAGDVTGRIDPSSPDYSTRETNSTTRVIKTFSRFHKDGDWRVITFRVKAQKDMYFRLRGTNLAVNVANETDAQGNPIIDEASYVDTPNPDPKAAAATPTIHGNLPDLVWNDLWFYSNPVFVDIK